MTNRILQDFIKYWDDVVADWFIAISKQQNPKVDKSISKFGVVSGMMPEPYWGNPENCSLVAVNINPGGGKEEQDSSGNHVMSSFENAVKAAGSYSKIALPFPLLDGVFNWKQIVPANWVPAYGGTRWWRKRYEWLKGFIDASNIKTDKKPFAIEICGWHSSSNSAARFKNFPGLDNLFLKPLREAILNSDLKLGIGICNITSMLTADLGFKLLGAYYGSQKNPTPAGIPNKLTAYGKNGVLQKNKRSYTVYEVTDPSMKNGARKGLLSFPDLG